MLNFGGVSIRSLFFFRKITPSLPPQKSQLINMNVAVKLKGGLSLPPKQKSFPKAAISKKKGQFVLNFAKYPLQIFCSIHVLLAGKKKQKCWEDVHVTCMKPGIFGCGKNQFFPPGFGWLKAGDITDQHEPLRWPFPFLQLLTTPLEAIFHKCFGGSFVVG